MQAYLFDDRNVTWQTVEPIGAQIYVLAVDDARGLVDVLIRFQPNAPGRVHRHLCDFSTFVLQGELRFQRPEEVRPTGAMCRSRQTASHIRKAPAIRPPSCCSASGVAPAT